MPGKWVYIGEQLGVIDGRHAYLHGDYKGSSGLYVLTEQIDDAQGWTWLRKDGTWGDVREGYFWDTKEKLLADIRHVLEATQ